METSLVLSMGMEVNMLKEKYLFLPPGISLEEREFPRKEK